MKVNVTPYGEARRLKYFIKICQVVLESPSVNMDFLASKIQGSIKAINSELDNYIRKTGIMQTRSVTENYLRFANWLNFIQIEGGLIVPNSYTVFVANLGNVKDFFLTSKEKIGLFKNLIGLNQFFSLTSSLHIQNSIKDFIRDDLSEHFVQTFFDWLVDLSILKPTSSRFGSFNLTSSIGYPVTELCKKVNDPLAITRIYASKVLDKPIVSKLNMSEKEFWNSFQRSATDLSQHSRSEIDSRLFSAFPIILDLQLRLVLENECLISIKEIIYKLKELLPLYNIIFSWDNLSNSGYIKFGA